MDSISRKALVSRADLHYQGTVARREGGLPIGNGQMGSMVFTSPSALKFAVNRADVFAADSATNSFNRRHSDYGYGCGFVDVDFVDFGKDVFDEDTVQHLSLYEACARLAGKGVEAEVFAEEKRDAFAIRVKDTRNYEGSVQVKVNMMRPSEFRTLSHLAVSRLTKHDNVIVLKQEFTEDEYYCASALAVWAENAESIIRMNNEVGGQRDMEIQDREFTVIGQPQETQMRLCLKPGAEEYEIYIVSAATFDREEDIVKTVLEKVRKVQADGYELLKKRHLEKWQRFWEKSYVRLESSDNIAQKLEQHYTYFFYLMESSSKGKYPPNFGGMIFSPCGDYRHWGTMQWWNNLSLYYNAIPMSGHCELMKPLFSFYGGMSHAAKEAARQQWGAKGMYLPEVTWFNGPEILPEDIAEEMRALYLFEKPWEEASAKFKDFVDRKHPHESRYNYKFYEHYEKGRVVYNERGYGPYGATTYMFGSQAGIAYSFWKYYQYTGDLDFLRETAYPIIKGVAEFFMTIPLTKKAEDGKYHIYKTCTDESYYGCTDGMENMAGMHAIIPVLLKAAEILNTDREHWKEWQEFADNLAPIPTTDMKDSVNPGKEGEPPMWSCGREPVLAYNKGFPSLYPCDHFDLSDMSTEDYCKERYEISVNTLKNLKMRQGVTGALLASEMSGCARMFAAHGMAEEFAAIANAQLDAVNAEKEYCYFADTGRIPVFENRLTVREGVNCISAQRLGNVAAAVQLALCQDSGGGPGADSVIRLFAAVPDSWNAEFSLWCRGGFRADACIEQGKVKSVEIYSGLGGKLRLYNPYGDTDNEVKVVSDGELVYEGCEGIIEADTAAGASYKVMRAYD